VGAAAVFEPLPEGPSATPTTDAPTVSLHAIAGSVRRGRHAPSGGALRPPCGGPGGLGPLGKFRQLQHHAPAPAKRIPIPYTARARRQWGPRSVPGRSHGRAPED
jgi:hypothetical protein